jgi:hypothetical protein
VGFVHVASCSGTARSNIPHGPWPVPPDRWRELPPVGGVRELQRKLWAAAKQSEGWCSYALFDQISTNAFPRGKSPLPTTVSAPLERR